MPDLRWQLVSPRCAALYRITRMKQPEPLAFLDCTDPAHLSRLMVAAEKTLVPQPDEGGEDHG